MKKKLITIISAVLAGMLMLGTFAGCDLISADNEADMAQVVAEVNIAGDSESLNLALERLAGKSELESEVSSSLDKILFTDEIYKRDLVAYFLSYGYNYLQSNSSSYADAFESIMNDLVQRKIIVQFATLYYLNEGEVLVDRDFIDFPDNGYTATGEGDALRMDSAVSVDSYLSAIESVDSSASSDERAIKGLELFLTEDEIKYAQYQVKQSINSAIDSYEEQIIAAEEDSTSTEETRTTPTGANETDTYYPVDASGDLNYDIYTGFNNASDCGEYEKVDGSTNFTRKQAYVRFLNVLNQNFLLARSEATGDITDITSLAYYDIELRSQYETLLINKFNATVALGNTSEADDFLSKYTSMMQEQSIAGTDVVSTMDSVSDTSFLLYTPANRTYGFVYNILLPFDADQTLEVTRLQNMYGSETVEYYAARQSLFGDIVATDQRSSWFNGSEDYSFDATENGMTAGTDYYDNGSNSDYLFFKDSFVAQGTRVADGIDRYTGKYPYNGTVEPRDDGSYYLKANELTIDEIIDEMESYLNFAVDSDAASNRASGSNNSAFSDDDVSFIKDNEINYEKMIYYKGSVAGVSAVSNDNYLVESEVSYKALSAFNELMFAYSTDTGCLNTYLGYAISSKEEATDYVKEFEYAAQEAIANGGAGTYYVVGTDYGWHILYVSFVYDGGDVYSGFNYEQRTEEYKGTFSYMFYQAMKSSVSESYSENLIGVIFDRMESSSEIVTKYEDRYSDLTSIGA